MQEVFIRRWNSVWLISIFYLWWPNCVPHIFRKSRQCLVRLRYGPEVESLARSAPSDYWCRPCAQTIQLLRSQGRYIGQTRKGDIFASQSVGWKCSFVIGCEFKIEFFFKLILYSDISCSNTIKIRVLIASRWSAELFICHGIAANWCVLRATHAYKSNKKSSTLLTGWNRRLCSGHPLSVSEDRSKKTEPINGCGNECGHPPLTGHPP